MRELWVIFDGDEPIFCSFNKKEIKDWMFGKSKRFVVKSYTEKTQNA